MGRRSAISGILNPTPNYRWLSHLRNLEEQTNPGLSYSQIIGCSRMESTPSSFRSRAYEPVTLTHDFRQPAPFHSAISWKRFLQSSAINPENPLKRFFRKRLMIPRQCEKCGQEASAQCPRMTWSTPGIPLSGKLIPVC